MRSIRALPILLLFISATMVGADEAPSTTSTEAVQVIGPGNIKKNTKGSLELKNGALYFISNKSDFSISAGNIQDVITGADTERAIRGTVGTLSQLAPYGAGRALSLFRENIDTLTIEYRDSNGALHGAVFTLPVGRAEPLKKELLSQGAQTSIPVKRDSNEPNARSDAQEAQR